MIVLLIVINLVVSVLNAWFVGRSWVETKAVGGWARFMSWMGATMASVGFSWCYLVVLAYLAGPDVANKLPEPYVHKMFALGYVAIVIPLIGSGLAITVDSWIYFWRKRTFASGAVAGYNTFADVYNIYQASRNLPGAWESAKSLFSSDDDDDNGGVFARLAIVLAVCALLGGVITAAIIIRTVSESTARARRLEHESASL